MGNVLVGQQSYGNLHGTGAAKVFVEHPAIMGHVTYTLTQTKDGLPITRVEMSTHSKSVSCLDLRLIVSMVTSMSLLSKTFLNGSYYLMSHTLEVTRSISSLRQCNNWIVCT